MGAPTHIRGGLSTRGCFPRGTIGGPGLAGWLEEVIQLGETYSILTEYTSFLVLENDSEFQRWKIARRNTDRLGRDRESQARWQAQLDQIRMKAIAGLGPEPALPAAAPSAPAKNIAAPALARSTNPEPAPVNQGNQSNPSPVPQQSRNFSVEGSL